MTDHVNLPMVCRHGASEPKAEEIIRRCVELLNASDDWIPVTSPSVDLLVMAIGYAGYGIEMHADQWFGVVAVKDSKPAVWVECDTVLDGLAAIYVHLRTEAVPEAPNVIQS